MMGKLVNEEEVKNALKIDSFRNLSKSKIMEFVSLIPNMDKEVAIKIIEQYPTFAAMSEVMVEQLSKMCDAALQKNEDSQKMTIQAYQKIIDELSLQLQRGELSKEEKEELIRRMIELADRISDKDTENKAFIDKMVKYKAAFAVGVVLLGAAILGVSVKGDGIPKL